MPNCKPEKTSDFFEFPKNAEKHKAWLELCGLKSVKKSDVICSGHFIESDFFYFVNKKSLNHNVYPSQNLSLPDSKLIENEHIEEEEAFTGCEQKNGPPTHKFAPL